MPRLEELRLDAEGQGTAMEATRRLLVPPSAGGVIRVTLESEDLAAVKDIAGFLFPAERNALNSGPSIIEIHAPDGFLANYTRGNRSFRFEVRDLAQGADYEAVRDAIQHFDLRLGHPVISVTISCDPPFDAEMLGLLSSSNVQSISISTYTPGRLANFLRATIGRNSSEVPEEAYIGEGEGDWEFQSVRYIAIDSYCRKFEDLEEVASVVTTRQEQLLAKGKSTLEEM
ncbi:hypothetical protein FRC01_004030, partial [Tulasnella sp. 417]